MLLLTAWTVLEVYKFKKILGSVVLAIIAIFSVQISIENFKPRDITYPQITNFIAEIYTKYPNSAIDIYECPFAGYMISTAASYIMYYQGRNTEDGVKIGVCNSEYKLTWREVRNDEINRPYGFAHKNPPNDLRR